MNLFYSILSVEMNAYTFDLCSDASFGYPGGPILFKNLNFGIDLDSRIASTNYLFQSYFIYCKE